MTALAVAAAPLTRRSQTAALVAAVRPQQWVKNLLVLAAPLAGGVLLQPSVAVRCALTVSAMVCASCAGYLVNDVLDQELDRTHPRKRLRPVASGALPVRLALCAAAVLLVSALVAAAVAGALVLAAVASYAAVTAAYALLLKHVPWWELSAVASGFVLRTVAGAAAARVPVSAWLLLAVSAAAGQIVVGKRSSELMSVGVATRPVLRSYTPAALRRVSLLTAAAVVAGYLGWAVTRGHLDAPGQAASLLSAVPVVLVVARWSRLTRLGASDAPEHVLVHDVVVRTGVLCWAAAFCVSLWLR